MKKQDTEAQGASTGPTTVGKEDSDQQDSRKKPVELEEVLVTGTHIAGTQSSSPVTTLDQRDIDRSGYTTVGDLLRSLPQNFSGAISPAATNSYTNAPTAGQNPTGASAPDLRGLGASSTLTLVNGRRLAVGYGAGTVDISSIPLIAVNRVEVVTDGASAVYGSDAVAGVVNFILKDSYEGIQTDLSYGAATAGGADERRASVLGGARWSTGNIILAYEHLSQDDVGADQRDFTSGAALPDSILPGTSSNAYLLSARQTIVPELAGFLEGNYFSKNTNFLESLRFVPGFAVANGAPSTQYNATAGFDLQLDHQWHAELAVGAAEQRNHFYDNYYATPGPIVLMPDANALYEGSIRSAELNANGPLFDFGSGPIKVAVGGGYRRETFESTNLGTGLNSLAQAGRNVRYGFAEIAAPLVSPSERVWLRELSLNISGRYEHYSDFGNAIVPKLGLVYSPFRGLHARASWGKSFRAPTLDQLYGLENLLLESLADPASPTKRSVVEYLEGSNRGLGPESARSLTVGLDYDIAFESARLKLSTTYFNVHYFDRLSQLNDGDAALTNPLDAPFVTRNPTVAQAQALVDALGIDSNRTKAPFDPATVAAIVNGRTVNIAQQYISGLDFLADGHLTTPIGSVDPFVNMAYLRYEQRTVPLAPMQEISGIAFNPPRFRARGGVTWNYAAWAFTTSVNFLSRETNTYKMGNPVVGSWTTIDTSLRYAPSLGGLFEGLNVRVSVQNLLDKSPPYVNYDAVTNGLNFDPLNTTPLGRFVTLQLSKNWKP